MRLVFRLEQLGGGGRRNAHPRHPGQIQTLHHQRCILFQDQNENQTSYFGTLRNLHGCVPGFLRVFKSSTRLYLRSGF
jgi:hypothetical protein